MRTSYRMAAVCAALLAGAGWLGLRIGPRPFPPHPEKTPELPGLFGLVKASYEGERFDQGENLAMWAEALFTTPSALVLDPRVRWEPIDDHSARLLVPFGGGEDTLQVDFAPSTGLIARMPGMRYRGQENKKTPWRGESSDWKERRGVLVPHKAVAVWEDQEQPYAIMEIEGAEYDVDGSEKIPGANQPLGGSS